MKIYDGFLPKNQKKGYMGYYPVTNAEEWEELPAVYKAMEWFPVEIYNSRWRHKETTVAEYIEFDVTYLEPYKIRAKVLVHVQEIQTILFCYFKDTQCHLHSISGVIFDNGEKWPAKWLQDSRTGSFAIYASGKPIGCQGGYMGFIPNNIERTEDGFKWSGVKTNGHRSHYEVTNPFE